MKLPQRLLLSHSLHCHSLHHPNSTLPALFMPDSKASQARKPWYQRAMEIATQWRALPKAAEVAPAATWKTVGKPQRLAPPVESVNSRSGGQLRKCTSLRLATTFTRVCLCAPISSYDDVFRAYAPPRRSHSYPASKRYQVQPEMKVVASKRPSTEGRRVFRGKSLTDDVLMRRFVVEEEAMMQVRRRNQMEAIRKRSLTRRKKLGPSPLRRMVLADQ